MKKIYISEDLFNEVLETQKGDVDKNMILTLINGKKYQLVLGIKFLEAIADNEDSSSDNLTGKIISKDELIAKNYELYDDEVLTNDRLYKVKVGYIGTLIE